MKFDDPMTLAGVVLAAGRSTRMGTDKALLLLHGQPLWLRQYKLLALVGVEVSERFLSARPDQTWVPRSVRRVTDPVADGGPLAGIVAAMAASRADHLLVLAVDLPCMPVAWFEHLRESLAPGIGAVGQRTTGSFEPLAAIYPKAMGKLMAEELSAGRHSLQAVITQAVAQGMLRLQTIDADKASWFENWNAPEEIRPRSLWP